MRVLIIQPWIQTGGAELLSLELAAALERHGDAAPIAALFVRAGGLPAALLDRRFLLPPPWLARRFAASRRLCYVLGPFVLLAIVLRAAGAAAVLDPHNVPAPFVAALAGRLRRRPVVWTCNEVPAALPPAEAARLGLTERIVWRLAAALSRAVAGQPREILVLSEKTRAAVRTAYGREATVVRPGFTRPPDGPVARRDGTPFGLLFVAKLHPQKDPLLAVEVLRAVRERGIAAHLTIVGDGPERAAVAARIGALGLDGAVALRPALAHEALAAAYRAADALLVTAGGHQSWGLTPFEALAAGTPAVLSDEAGAAEVLGPASAALVVPRTAAAFAAAIERLARDPALGPRLVANGAPLLATLTWERYAEGCRAAFVRATRR